MGSRDFLVRSRIGDVESRVFDRGAGIFDQESPVFDRESPVFDRESPVFDRESPVFDRSVEERSRERRTSRVLFSKITQGTTCGDSDAQLFALL